MSCSSNLHSLCDSKICLSSEKHHSDQVNLIDVPYPLTLALALPFTHSQGCKPGRALGCGGARRWLWLPFVNLKQPQNFILTHARTNTHTCLQNNISIHGAACGQRSGQLPLCRWLSLHVHIQYDAFLCGFCSTSH